MPTYSVYFWKHYKYTGNSGFTGIADQTGGQQVTASVTGMPKGRTN